MPSRSRRAGIKTTGDSVTYSNGSILRSLFWSGGVIRPIPRGGLRQGMTRSKGVRSPTDMQTLLGSIRYSRSGMMYAC